jgi:aminoglycoside phosphotransferase
MATSSPTRQAVTQAQARMRRLADAGFSVVPTETAEGDLQAEISRLQDAKRRALQIADERAKEATELRLENERLRSRLAEWDRS